MDLELAEAMGQCSTSFADDNSDPEIPTDDPEIRAIDSRPRPSSAASDSKVDAHEQPPRPHSTPPTCTGIVSEMIDNIFRNVLVSIETNDVAVGLVIAHLCKSLR